MKKYCAFLLLFATCACGIISSAEDEPLIVGYVTSWGKGVPDPQYLTHINYAFGHVNDSCNGIRIDNLKRLNSIVKLKHRKPSLKIMLSIGGWGSGRFSEMAADPVKRQAFARDCRRVIDAFGLDGIDIDWEYPTSRAANISASSDDTQNYTLLMQDIRQAIGAEKLLTLASAASAEYIDFHAIMPTVDFVNIMAYDMAQPPKHHSILYPSKYAGRTAERAVNAHITAGVPAEKLVLGVPFYGRGKGKIPNFINYRKILELRGFERRWDDEGKAPYLVDDKGNMVCGYDDPQSLAEKCRYIRKHGLRGAMFWDYDGDTEDGILRKTLYTELYKDQ